MRQKLRTVSKSQEGKATVDSRYYRRRPPFQNGAGYTARPLCLTDHTEGREPLHPSDLTSEC